MTREAASSSRYRAVVDENGIVAHDIDAHAAATAAAGEVGVSTRATRAAVDCSAIAERAAVAQQSKPVTTRATTASKRALTAETTTTTAQPPGDCPGVVNYRSVASCREPPSAGTAASGDSVWFTAVAAVAARQGNITGDIETRLSTEDGVAPAAAPAATE